MNFVLEFLFVVFGIYCRCLFPLTMQNYIRFQGWHGQMMKGFRTGCEIHTLHKRFIVCTFSSIERQQDK